MKVELILFLYVRRLLIICIQLMPHPVDMHVNIIIMLLCGFHMFRFLDVCDTPAISNCVWDAGCWMWSIPCLPVCFVLMC